MNILTGIDARKYDFASDTFRGLAELNNYELAITNGEAIDNIEEYKYFSCSNGLFSLYALNYNSIYINAEIINIGIKYAMIMNFKKMSVNVKNNNLPINDFNNILESLESIEITYNIDASLKGKEDALFEIVSGKTIIARGSLDGDNATLIINYDNIKDMIDDRYIKPNNVDVYVKPENDSNNPDALIIGTMLRDAGYKVEVGYNNIYKNIDASYSVTINNKTQESFKVILEDLKTKEKKEVSINNLVDELDMNF